VLVLHPDPRYRVLVLPLLGGRVSVLSRAKHGEMIPVPARFLGDEYARLLDGPAHVGPIERRFEMTDLRSRLAGGRDSGVSARRVLLVPGGARNAMRDDPLRRWPPAHYARLAELLIASGCEVVLIGGEHDGWTRPNFAGVPVVDRIGALSLRETLELMARSALVISHDTGPMHLARLVRVPLLALFGPTIPEQVLSIDDSVTVVWGGRHLACRPCFDGREFARCANNVCLSSVEPAQVATAALKILEVREAIQVDARSPSLTP
jgi:heptosyltransferase-2